MHIEIIRELIYIARAINMRALKLHYTLLKKSEKKIVEIYT